MHNFIAKDTIRNCITKDIVMNDNDDTIAVMQLVALFQVKCKTNSPRTNHDNNSRTPLPSSNQIIKKNQNQTVVIRNKGCHLLQQEHYLLQQQQ